jgi:type IV fimbrial biogenesis protein FimT
MTLLELMVTVVVIGIMAAVAMPSFREMTERSRLTAAANDIVAALQTARMEAIRRNARVELCPTTDGASCSGSDWSRFAVIARKGDEDIQVRDVRLSGVTLRASNQVASENLIAFGADGFARIGTAQSGAISACSTRLEGANAVDVSINVSRVSTLKRPGGASCSAPADP